MSDIVIRNLKNVQSLEFNIPTSGVHVISGSNGSGKTTLLTCLERLQNSYAFSRHFRTSSHEQFDVFSQGEVIYSRNGQSVRYRYRNTRWSPTPRSNAHILRGFPFARVIFLPSTGERFYVQEEELNTRNIHAASNFLRDAMCDIFQTQKFNELRQIKLEGRGLGDNRRNHAFVLPSGTNGHLRVYYSEKNFSLGEVLILNALYSLREAPNQSLILIDEVELALHPRVQIRFLRFLEQIAREKKFSVLISTHSASLIKAAPKLIHLERNSDSGNIDVIYDCFPALALKNVAVEEEVQPDFVFFTEDIMGKCLLDFYLDYYFTHLNQSRRPIMKTLPVAGWKQTIMFLVNSNVYLIPKHTKAFCFLDRDAGDDLQRIQQDANRGASSQELLNIYNANRNSIQFFDITPEEGIVNFLYQNTFANIARMQTFFQQGFDISQLIQTEQARGINYSPTPRTAAKTKLSFLVGRIAQSISKSEDQTRAMIVQYYISAVAPSQHNYLRQLFNPIFN